MVTTAIIIINVINQPEPIDYEAESTSLMSEAQMFVADGGDEAFNSLEQRLKDFIASSEESGNTRAVANGTVALSRLYEKVLYHSEAEQLLYDFINSTDNYADKVIAIRYLDNFFVDTNRMDKRIQLAELVTSYPDDDNIVLYEGDDWAHFKEEFQYILDNSTREES